MDFVYYSCHFSKSKRIAQIGLHQGITCRGRYLTCKNEKANPSRGGGAKLGVSFFGDSPAAEALFSCSSRVALMLLDSSMLRLVRALSLFLCPHRGCRAQATQRRGLPIECKDIMGNSRRNKHLGLIGLFATVIFACAWLLPVSAVTAASKSGATRVTVNVSDAIGVDFGKSALDFSQGHWFCRTTTKLVTQTASSQLILGPAADITAGRSLMADFGLSFGHPAVTDTDGAALGGETRSSDFPVTEILVTVCNL